MAQPGDVFSIGDQGDGWWHCPRRLQCVVIDGPGPVLTVDAAPRSTWLLARTRPGIEWNGDRLYVDRWGHDHPLGHPIAPTDRLLILASHDRSETDFGGDWSIPAYPVANRACRLVDVQIVNGLGIKVAVSKLG